MPINFQPAAQDYDKLVRSLIVAQEDKKRFPYRVAREHTITIGIGYTLLRKGASGWFRHNFDKELRDSKIAYPINDPKNKSDPFDQLEALVSGLLSSNIGLLR